MDFTRFRGEVSRRSGSRLLAKERCSTHWQIWHNDECLVDVWPTTNKYRQSNLEAGLAAAKGDPYVAIDRALEMLVPAPKTKPVGNPQPAGTVTVRLSQEYLKELAEKVEHGFNLLNEEARHLFAHAGILVPKHKRCERCNNDGTIRTIIPGTTRYETEVCPICLGRRGPVQQTQPLRELSWAYDYKGRWIANSSDKDFQGDERTWKIDATTKGSFWIGRSDFIIDEDSCEFPTLQEAKDCCQKHERHIAECAIHKYA